MSERNAVQQAFDRFGREAGLERRSGSWYLQRDEVIAVSNLQKSQYGPGYYFNQGFWLRQLGDEPYPNVNRCHVQARLEDLLPDRERRIGELLDLDHRMPDDERMDALLTLLKAELMPLIQRGSSVSGLRAMLEADALAGAAIAGPAQLVLAPGR